MSLTLETMRADIAAVLHEQPEDVGLDDNLLDLGVDSLRAMNLITKWSESGVNLEFSELAEDVTLAAWWKLVQAKQGA